MILVPLTGGAPVALSKAVMFFGRGSECDIVLAHSRKVSRKHCCIAQIDDSYLVRDLGSMNGVRVNGEKADPELPLRPGDEVVIGDVSYRFQCLQPVATDTIDINHDPLRKGIIDPKLQSTDLPMAIPDENIDFVVEQTGRVPMIPDDELRFHEEQDEQVGGDDE